MLTCVVYSFLQKRVSFQLDLARQLWGYFYCRFYLILLYLEVSFEFFYSFVMLLFFRFLFLSELPRAGHAKCVKKFDCLIFAGHSSCPSLSHTSSAGDPGISNTCIIRVTYLKNKVSLLLEDKVLVSCAFIWGRKSFTLCG